MAWVWAAIRRRVPDRLPSIEEAFLLVLAVSMVVFAIDWALRIIGWR